jgi:pimeloyl-ACP methyl ester carboxylesterase
MIERFTSADGTSIACARSGSGRPLVLVHGTTADHTRWKPVLSTLEQKFMVYACDRRGRGLSSDAWEYSLEREVEDIVAIVEGIGGDVDLLGHSHGGLVSLEAARRTKLRSLILYEPPIATSGPLIAPEMIQALEAKLAAGDRDSVVTYFFQQGARMPPEQIEKLRALAAWQSRVAAAHTIPRELRMNREYTFDAKRFAEVSTPTLLLVGGASPPMFPAAIDAVHRALRNSRVVVLDGQQHVAMDTAPELFLREVLAFLT